MKKAISVAVTTVFLAGLAIIPASSANASCQDAFERRYAKLVDKVNPNSRALINKCRR